jgi:hypothetical protein
MVATHITTDSPRFYHGLHPKNSKNPCKTELPPQEIKFPTKVQI